MPAWVLHDHVVFVCDPGHGTTHHFPLGRGHGFDQGRVAPGRWYLRIGAQDVFVNIPRSGGGVVIGIIRRAGPDGTLAVDIKLARHFRGVHPCLPDVERAVCESPAFHLLPARDHHAFAGRGLIEYLRAGCAGV